MTLRSTAALLLCQFTHPQIPFMLVALNHSCLREMHQEANKGPFQILQARRHEDHALVADQEQPTFPHYNHPQAYKCMNFQRLFSNAPRTNLSSQLWLPHDLSSSSEASSLTLNSQDGFMGFNMPETKDEEQMEEFDMIVNERRVRRLISNRESARRSRMTKRKQLEELQGQVLQLLAANHQLTEKLNHVLESNYRVLQENSHLKEDNSSLRMVVADLMNHQHDARVDPQGGGDDVVERNMTRVRPTHTTTASMNLIH